MIKAAIEKIENMAAAIQYSIAGRNYSSKPLCPVIDPSPEALKLGTLTGLVDYIKSNVDPLLLAKLLIVIDSYETVSLRSSLSAEFAQRHTYILAKSDSFKFPFGQFMDVESFIIRLQSQFVQDETTAAILQIVGNVKDGMVKEFADDGVTQQVTAKAGVSRVENVKVPNPVELAPFRTFLEIEQPKSRFVFRMRSGEGAPTCALFEGDGGTWKNEAVKKIKEWIEEKSTGVQVIA